MKLLICSIFLISSIAFADSSKNLSHFSETEIISLVDQEVGLNNTCLDEYLTRQQQLKKFLIWAPPATVVGAPVGFVVSGFSTAMLLAAVNVTKWSALGYTILAAVGTGVGIVGSFTYLEISGGIEYYLNNQMIHIITAAHNDFDNNKYLVKMYRKYNKKFSRKPLTMNELKQRIVELDESGLLCDGTVRGYINPKNLKYSLAKRKHLLKYIFNYE